MLQDMTTADGNAVDDPAADAGEPLRAACLPAPRHLGKCANLPLRDVGGGGIKMLRENVDRGAIARKRGGIPSQNIENQRPGLRVIREPRRQMILGEKR